MLALPMAPMPHRTTTTGSRKFLGIFRTETKNRIPSSMNSIMKIADSTMAKKMA